jgi:pimeloyl-ACP methyl ester carboxylesterase
LAAKAAAETMVPKKSRLLVFLLLGCVMIANRNLVLAADQPAPPTLVDVNPSGNEGDYLIGAIPPGFKPEQPVLVFVQGLGSSAVSWWGPTEYYGNNDMYQYAYKAGYRTAFVNFRDADATPGDMWRNGSVLSKQLESICRYFNVARVNLICHSKGGIDAQTAIVHYGAAPYVAKVVTLSAPHWGSQLADLAYSSWASWLSKLLKAQNDGAYSLQTAYMSYFRSVTDGRAENDGVAYFTAAGTDWGPLFSGLYLGGTYLSAYGDNDGSVTVESAHNPRATHLKTSKLNHDNIRIASKSWQYIEPRINSYISAKGLDIRRNAPTAGNNAPAVSNFFVQGGAFKSGTTIELPVDSLTRRLDVDLLVGAPQVTVKVVAPDGTGYAPTTICQDTVFFKGAVHHHFQLDQPEKGYWRVWINSKQDNAYLLIARYDSALKLNTNLLKRRAQVNSTFKFTVNVADGKNGARIKGLSVSTGLSRVMGQRQIGPVTELPFRSHDNCFEHEVALPAEPGLYNVMIALQGTLDDGTPFARSLIHSLLVESKRQKGVKLLQTLPSGGK